MGKDLKGRELGIGISQRKDGYYTARFVDRSGRNVQKYFKKLQECRQWIADAKFNDEQGNIFYSEKITVNALFDLWMDSKRNQIRSKTIFLYEERYRINIKEKIGDMLIQDVRQMHCQKVLLDMVEQYSDCVIEHARLVMRSIFCFAVENEMILKNPVTKSVNAKSLKSKTSRTAMTLEEQKLLTNDEKCKKSQFYNAWMFDLQTGLRCGELSALTWDDVNFEEKTINVNKSISMNKRTRKMEIGEPKTESGVRTIPLTEEAIRILKEQKKKNKTIKVINMEYKDNIFVTKKGSVMNCELLDQSLRDKCRQIGIKHISMHILRHTFATRCIEAGMKPKTLQTILGHSKIEMTMNLYVHTTEDEKNKEMSLIEERLCVV